MRESADASFTFLSDPDGALMDLLDVRHARGRYDGADIAQSANALVTPEGRVVWLHAAENYRKRVAPEAILAIIDERLGSATQAAR